MKGLKIASTKSQAIVQKDRSTWVSLYYSIEEDKVFTEDGKGRYFVCNLISPNTPKEVQEAVEIWKRM